MQKGRQKGRVLREDLYKGLAQGVNATYFSWINTNASNCYLRR